MIRNFEVQPSAQLEIDGQLVPIVTEEDLAIAFARLATVLTISGGCGSVVTQRVATGTPDEYLTTRAIVTWQARTKDTRQPEQTVPIAEAAQEPGPFEEPPREQVPPLPPTDGIDDGLVVDPEAVDESDVPLELRTT